MEGAIARRSSPIALRPWPILTALAIVAPLVSLFVVLQQPYASVRLQDAAQHFAITTNIAMVAAVVALLVARNALDVGSYRALLVALGFMCMAGIFAVHGLATPGVLFVGEQRESAASLVVAMSAQLSLLIPGLFFAVRYTPLVRWLEGSMLFRPRRLISLTAGALVLFGVVAIGSPEFTGSAMEMMTGYGASDFAYAGYGATYEQYGLWVVVLGGGTIALLVFAGWRQAAEFMRSRLPTHAALGVSFVFLAEAQLAMILGAVFSIAFWSYHALMAAAALLAIGSLFVELDRRRGLERFLPPNVVERVVTGDRLSLEGERRSVTILFTDLRGSTALAERISPEATIEVLNAYLRIMARAVINEGGILDKFTGDGLMAIFGAMGDRTDGAEAAVRAASRMRADLAALNVERSARGEPVVGHGVGLHSGPVVLGQVGLPERSDYTAIGDTVNTAARMEGLSKELRVDVVISGETASRLDGAVPVRPLGEVAVRGKEQPVPVFTLS